MCKIFFIHFKKKLVKNFTIRHFLTAFRQSAGFGAVSLCSNLFSVECDAFY